MRDPLLKGAGGSAAKSRISGRGFIKFRSLAVTVVLMVLGAVCMQPIATQAAPKAATTAAMTAMPVAKKVSVSPEVETQERALLLKLGNASGAARKEFMQALAKTGDQRLETIFRDFTDGSLYIWKEQVVLCAQMEPAAAGLTDKIAPLSDPFSREPIVEGEMQARIAAKELKEIAVTGRDRVQTRDALNLLRLSNPDRDARLAAIIKSGEGAVETNLDALEELAKSEKDPVVLPALRESIALIRIVKAGDDSTTRATRLDAVKFLGEIRSARALGPLTRLRKDETDRAAQAVLNNAVTRIQNWQSVVEWTGNIFSGLSLSSVLILMALGLAIVFGLMGVINMAHGELMMIGAYATYMTQQMFTSYFPNAFDWYFIVAIPVSFIAAGLVGMLLEALIIRHLYGRPLDTLLATLGVSFILIQLIRCIFGDNIGVNAPSWLQGSMEVVQDVRLPYNRIFIMGFCLACIGLMYFIVDRTKLGLLLRATTQNRTMAASLGVSTRKIDMLTFGLGSGLAGMAGCALTQIGGVTPDMGQNYVIDSFLVVVVGGVGKLAGAIWSGLGLGMTNKFLEPVTGAVWAKVLILILVVAFIQRKPSGLFPAKGRLADV